MGLFSGISKALFGDPGKGIRRAERRNQEFMQKGLDYQRESDAPLLEARNFGLQGLRDYYTGGEGQQALIDDVRSSPFYNQMIQSGQEGVLAKAGMEGLTRSDDALRTLNRSNQGVLQNLVNQRLGGYRGLASFRPNTEAITNMYTGMGSNAAQSGIAQTNAEQQQIGQLINLGTSVAGGMGG